MAGTHARHVAGQQLYLAAPPVTEIKAQSAGL